MQHCYFFIFAENCCFVQMFIKVFKNVLSCCYYCFRSQFVCILLTLIILFHTFVYNNSVQPSDFEFLKVIGKGSFGKVLLARHKSEHKIYAVKVLQKAAIVKRNEVRHIMSERNVLVKNVQHPFLVGLHYSFQTSKKLYFVLDYVNGGEVNAARFPSQ